jgi:sucrose phosphorylase
MKRNSDGTDSPYELNCTWFDIMGMAGEDVSLHEARFLCSQTIPLVLQGIPAVYFHSMTATPNDQDEVQRTKQARSINRGHWNQSELEAKFADPATTASRMFVEMQQRLKLRQRYAAFHPNAGQKILSVDERIFAVMRLPAAGEPAVLAVANVTASPLTLSEGSFHIADLGQGEFEDALTPSDMWNPDKPLKLAPYQCSWFVLRKQ